MSRLYTGGFELGHQQPEGMVRNGAAGGLTFATDKARTGGRSLKVASGTAIGNYLTRLQTGTSGRRYWSRCYIWIASGSLSDAQLIVEAYCTNTSTWAELHADTAGNLAFDTSAGGSATYGAIPRDQWVMIEFGVTVNTGSSDTFDVYMNDVKQNGSTITVAWSSSNITGFNYGNDGSASTTRDMWWDDIAINDDQGASQNGRPGSGKVYYLMPVGDGTAGTNEANWAKPGGSTSNKYSSVDNIPPVFAADTTSAGSAESFLRNATAASSDVTLACTDYTTAGVGSDDIAIVQPIALLGSSSATANSGTLGMPSNPAISQITAAFPTAVASATATTWTRREGTTTYAPSVTKGTQPQIRLNRAATSSGTKMVDSLAIVVEAVPATDTTPPGTVNVTPTTTRISRVSGKDSDDLAFTADEAFVEYDIRVVPSTGSNHTAGTSIKTATVASRTSDTVTITDDEVIAASGGAGTFHIKVFVRDAAGNWSI